MFFEHLVETLFAFAIFSPTYCLEDQERRTTFKKFPKSLYNATLLDILALLTLNNGPLYVY